MTNDSTRQPIPHFILELSRVFQEGNKDLFLNEIGNGDGSGAIYRAYATKPDTDLRVAGEEGGIQDGIGPSGLGGMIASAVTSDNYQPIDSGEYRYPEGM